MQNKQTFSNASISPYEKEFRKVAKEHLRDYVESVTDWVPKFGANFYVCPCCKSGTGNNQHFTPAFHLFRSKNDELCFKCHACGITGNIFTLAGLVNHTSSFRKQRQLVAAFLGIDLERQTPLTNIRVSDRQVAENPSRKRTIQLKKDVRNHILNCHTHVSETDYFRRRGLSEKTIERFYLGYDPKRQEAIIPFGMGYYIGRNVNVGVDEKGERKHRKPAGLNQPLFNMAAFSVKADEPIFVVEAPLDALSIMQCGGTAIALGGTSTKIFEKVLKVYHPYNHFVLALDNDPPGQRAQSTLATLLQEYKLPYSLPEHSVFSRYKDANAILMAEPHSLKEATSLEKERLRDRALLKTTAPASLEEARLAAKITVAAKQALRHFEHSRKVANLEER